MATEDREPIVPIAAAQGNIDTPESLERDLRGLAWLAERYAATVRVFWTSLTEEFLPASETAEDWDASLSLLREAAFPLGEFLSSHPDLPNDHRSYFSVIDRCVCDAKVALVTRTAPDCDAASAINCAIDHIEDAVGYAEDWLSLLPSEGEHPSTYDLDGAKSRAAVERLLDRQQTRLDRVVEDVLRVGKLDDPLCYRVCMTSRKSFLVACAAASMNPLAWNESRYEALIRGHEALLRAMRDGSPFRTSIRKRRDRIEQLQLLRKTAA